MFKWRITEKEFKPIPYFPNYSINGYGVIVDSRSGNTITVNAGTVLLDEQLFVVADLVCVVHKNVHISRNDISKMSTGFIDGDTSNLDVDNLVYRFNDLRVPGMPTFRVIPTYTRYGIDFHGNIVEIETKRVVGRHFPKNNDRYVTARLIHDCRDQTANRLVHRCVALAWLWYPENVDTMDVNHLDGIKTNCVGSNLEWATRRRNNLHAVSTGLMDFAHAVDVWDTKCDVVTRYDSLRQAAEQMGVTDTTAGHRAKTRKLYDGRWMVKLATDDRGWLDPTQWRNMVVGSGIPRQVLITLRDGSVLTARSSMEASRLTGINSATISYRLNHGVTAPDKLGYSFSYVEI